jgi:hypothetical protein
MNVGRGMRGQRSVRACAAEMEAKQEQEQERAQRTNIKRVESTVDRVGVEKRAKEWTCLGETTT